MILGRSPGQHSHPGERNSGTDSTKQQEPAAKQLHIKFIPPKAFGGIIFIGKTENQRPFRFFSFSKNALLNIAYSSSVHTCLQSGSNEDVTSKHSLILSHGNCEHCPQCSICLSIVHFITLYLHQLSSLHPVQEISSFETTWSL